MVQSIKLSRVVVRGSNILPLLLYSTAREYSVRTYVTEKKGDGGEQQQQANNTGTNRTSYYFHTSLSVW
jgi:hypothetical protein